MSVLNIMMTFGSAGVTALSILSFDSNLKQTVCFQTQPISSSERAPATVDLEMRYVRMDCYLELLKMDI